MPPKQLKPCNTIGCKELTTERFCATHQKKDRQYIDQQRGTAAQRGYDAQWRRARKMYLARHPLCVECMGEGRTVGATVIDHVIAHKGDYERFWDQGNWQALCKRHHDIKTVKEDGGFGR